MITKSIIKAKDYDVKIKFGREEAYIPLEAIPIFKAMRQEIADLKREIGVMSDNSFKDLEKARAEYRALEKRINNISAELGVLTTSINYINKGLKRR